MKTSYKFFGLLSLLLLLICCSSIRDEQFKYKFFKNYPKEVINSNWNQFYKDDITASLDATKNLFSLRMDGYGSIYPGDDTILSGITNRDFSGNQKMVDQCDITFYKLFRDKDEKIGKNVERIKDVNRHAFYETLLRHSAAGSIDSFTITWDAHFIKEYTRKLNETLRARNKKKVVFFIHGYNVPYSLATIQCMEFIKLAKQNGVAVEEYLFVPVYWPSNDMKNHELDSGKLNTFNHRNYRNGRRFGYYSNRAYYSALTLRQIITKISPEVSVRIFSHSLGATLATTTLIDTKAKFQHPRRGSKSGPITDDLEKIMKLYPPPGREIKVFMNVPAIPGENTFTDLEAAYGKNYWFYVGFNPEDEMVSKRGIPSKIYKQGSTTLGCDYRFESSDKGEVERTRLLVSNEKLLPGHFIAARVGVQRDHDIFTYYEQRGFIEMMKTFFDVAEK